MVWAHHGPMGSQACAHHGPWDAQAWVHHGPWEAQAWANGGPKLGPIMAHGGSKLRPIIEGTRRNKNMTRARILEQEQEHVPCIYIYICFSNVALCE
jgi:hypothetical protein